MEEDTSLINSLPLKFNQNNLEEVIQKFSKNNERFMIIESGTITTRLTAIKAFRALEVVMEGKFQFHQLQKFEAKLDDYIESFGKDDNVNMFLIDCGNVMHLSEFVEKLFDKMGSKMCVFVTKIKGIVQCSKCKFFKIFQDKNHFELLTPDSQALVLDQLVSFQGHHIKLSKLISPEIAKTMLDDVRLNELFSETEFQIGDIIPAVLPNSYISRKLYRQAPVFDSQIGDSFQLTVVKTQQEYEENAKTSKRVLFVEDYKDDKLIYKKSTIIELPCILYGVKVEATLNEIIEDKNVVICGELGSGKTEYLAAMSTQVKINNIDKWVCRINMKDLLHYLDHVFSPEEDENENYRTFLQYLLKNILNLRTQLERLLFEHVSSGEKQLMLLIDDVDDISKLETYDKPHNVDMFLEFLRSGPIDFIGCTCKPKHKNAVVYACQSYPYILEDLTADDKLELLKRYWITKSKDTVNHENCEVFARHVIHQQASVLNKSDGVYGNAILRCQLVAEIFYDDLIKYLTSTSDELPELSTLSQLELYERYFQLNYDAFLRGTTQTPEEKPMLPNIQEMHYKLVKDQLLEDVSEVQYQPQTEPRRSRVRRLFSITSFVKVLLPKKKTISKEDNLKITIPDYSHVVDNITEIKMVYQSPTGHYHFVHESFVSYVIAQYLVNNQNDDNNKIILKLLEGASEQFQTQFFNDVMEKYRQLAASFVSSLPSGRDNDSILMKAGRDNNTYILQVFIESMETDKVKEVISIIKDYAIDNSNIALLDVLFEWVKFKSNDKQLIREFITTGALSSILQSSKPDSAMLVFQRVIEYIQYLLDNDFVAVEDMEKLYLASYGSNILMYGLHHQNFGLAKPMIEFFESKMGPTFTADLVRNKPGENNCLIYMATKFSVENSEMLDKLNDEADSLLQWLRKANVPLDYKLQLFFDRNDIRGSVWEYLLTPDVCGQIEYFKRLLDFAHELFVEKYGDDTQTRDKQLLRTSMKFISFCSGEVNLLEIFLKWLKSNFDKSFHLDILSIRNDQELLPIQYHALRCHSNQLKCLVKFILDEFDDEDCLRLLGLLDMNALNEVRPLLDNIPELIIMILQSIEKLNAESEFHKILTEKRLMFNGEKIMEHNLGVLIEAVRCHKTIVDFYLTRMKQFECLEKTFPLTLYINDYTLITDFDAFLENVKVQESPFLKTFLTRRIYDNNILEENLMAWRADRSICYKILDLLETHADNETLIQVLQPCNEERPSLVFYLPIEKDLFIKCLSVIKLKNLDKNIIYKLLMEGSNNGCPITIFESLDCIDTLEVFGSFVKEFFDKQEINAMIRKCEPDMRKKFSFYVK